jgi:hypothetical protein
MAVSASNLNCRRGKQQAVLCFLSVQVFEGGVISINYLKAPRVFWWTDTTLGDYNAVEMVTRRRPRTTLKKLTFE